MANNDDNRLDRVTLEQIRIRVARQVAEEHVPAQDAAAALGLNRSTVYNWALKYRRGGVEALLARPTPGRSPKLAEEHQAQLYSLIRRDPRTLGFDRALWTRDMVRQLIRQEFGVSLTLAPVGKLLHKLGLSPQRPTWRAYEQDPDAVQRWKTEQYPAIRAEAAEAGATVFFLDEAGISWDEHAGTTWAPVGRTPVVTSTGKHFKINLISAVTARGALRFAVYGDAFRAPVFIDFCRRLMHDAPGPAYLVLDGHPVHRANAVKDFVAGTEGRLRLCFLPGYSPELNPDEWVWKNVKHDRIGPAGLDDERDLVAKARSAMHRLQKLPEVVRGFFGDPDLAYVTA
jgi:transposase